MSQSTPTAVTKRKVMGRMDAGPSESPSNNVTPNARPRIVRAQHGYSSPSFSNNVTPTATRPTPGTGRARVDMSAFASPSSVASSPAMSPSVTGGRPVSASSAGSNTITARLSAPSPTVRSTPTFHGRSGSTVGVGVSSSSYRLNEARIDPSGDANLASLRSPRLRGRNGSIDLGGASPSVASPSTRVSAASSQLSSSMSVRSPTPRADQSPFQKPSTPSASIRPTSSMSSRKLLSPQRSQETLDPAARIATNRPASPSKPPTSPAPSSTGFSQQQTSPPKPHPYARSSDPIVPGCQAFTPTTAMPVAIGTSSSSMGHGTTNGSAACAGEQALYAISPSERPFANASAGPRMEPGSAMTTGRAGLRPAPALHRSSIPPSFMDLATATPTAPLRPDLHQRPSFASSSFSTSSAASQPLSPSSETPRSPSETGEADEARIHRKLLDLEITNKSLLAINSALEVTKLKQAKEIRELKRRLRDGRGLSSVVPARESQGSVLTDDDFSDSDSDVQEDPELEAAHQRCKDLVDRMVESARKAILADYEGDEKAGGKVLHPAELEEMQRELDDAEEADEVDVTDVTDVTGVTGVADASEVSMTFDTEDGGDSSEVEEGLPSSSSLKFGLIPSDSATSVAEDVVSQQRLHPDSAYRGPLPGDVSID